MHPKPEYEWTKSAEEEKKPTPSLLVGVYTAQAGWAPNRFLGAGLRKELVQLSQAVEYITTRREVQPKPSRVPGHWTIPHACLDH